MPLPLTHEQCQKEICAAYGGKAEASKVTEALGEKIRKWAQYSWRSDVISYSTGICVPCRVALTICEKQQSDELPDRPGLNSRWREFKLEQIEVSTGQLASSFSCSICKARKSNPIGKLGSKIVTQKKQVKPNGQDHTQDPNENKITSCSLCFQNRTGRGIPHICNETTRKKNLSEIIINEGSIAAEQIVSKVLKDVRKEKGIESSKGI